MTGGLDKVLASQQIRERVEQGLIHTPLTDTVIQPASLDSTAEDVAFRLDPEVAGLFRAVENEQVYRTLLQLPINARPRETLEGGLELKVGFSYLLPLNQTLALQGREYVECSPKSSIGRVFALSRVLADFNPSYDVIRANYRSGEQLRLWALVQPLKFNVVVHPGQPLSQLRFLTGPDARLTAAEILAEHEREPLLLEKDEAGELVPAVPFVTNGLQIHLDARGTKTACIIGLRARPNPHPIDLSKAKECRAEDYFEPIFSSGSPMLHSQEGYLLVSREVLRIPPHLNMKLHRYSSVGMSGPLDFAGFGDPGFFGDLVFEVKPDERTPVSLKHGMPMSELDIFRNDPPDKVYGAEIGSNYQGQSGPRTAKYFTLIDFARAARRHVRLNREVLVQDRNILLATRSMQEGFEPANGMQNRLFDTINSGFFQWRYHCEDDDLLLQLVPYILIFGPDGRIFTYKRAGNIDDYSETKLFDRQSIGVSSHIRKEDGPLLTMNAVMRTLHTEVQLGNCSDPRFLGTIVYNRDPVDRVHFGLVYGVRTDGDVRPKDRSLAGGSLVAIDNVVSPERPLESFENWSQILVPELPKLARCLVA